MILTWNLHQQLNLTREKRQRQKNNDDFMSTDYDSIVFFPSYGHFAPIQKTDFGRMVYNIYIFINNDLSSYKNCKQN